jgi:hypothetical protein
VDMIILSPKSKKNETTPEESSRRSMAHSDMTAHTGIRAIAKRPVIEEITD